MTRESERAWIVRAQCQERQNRRRSTVKHYSPSSHTPWRCSFAFPVFTIRAQDRDSPFGRADVDIFVSSRIWPKMTLPIFLFFQSFSVEERSTMTLWVGNALVGGRRALCVGQMGVGGEENLTWETWGREGEENLVWEIDEENVQVGGKIWDLLVSF